MDVVDRLEAVADRRPGPPLRADRDRLDRALRVAPRGAPAPPADSARGGVTFDTGTASERESQMATVEQHLPETQNGAPVAGRRDPGREPGDRRDHRHRPRPRRRGGRRDGRPRARGPAGVGGLRLRGPRTRAAPGPEVGDGQRRPDRRDDRLGDRQDLRGRPARRDRLRRHRLRLLGQGGARATSPTRRSSPASCW